MATSFCRMVLLEFWGLGRDRKVRGSFDFIMLVILNLFLSLCGLMLFT